MRFSVSSGLPKFVRCSALSLACAGAALGQDECQTATPLSAGVTFGTTRTATTSPTTGSCGAPMGNDVWFVYTAPTTGRATASLCGSSLGFADFDACLAAFSGTCGALAEIACNDDHCASAPEIAFPVVAGQSYYIAVGGSQGEIGMFFLAMFDPVHDECTTAIPIGLGVTLGSNERATTSAMTGSCGMTNDVWYSVTPLVDDVLVASSCAPGFAAFDTVLAAFAGSCGTLTEIACNDDTCGDASEITFPVSAGQTYYVAVGGSGGATGDFRLELRGRPGHDTCARALPIGLGLTDGSNARATTGAVTGSCGSMGSDVWYVFTAPRDEVITAGFCAPGATADFDTALAVFSGDCGGLTEVACGNDQCGTGARVQFQTRAGEAYYLAVGGAGGAQGQFTLSLDAPPANDDCVGAVPIGVGVTSGTTVGATLSAYASGCAALDAEVWYSYMAPRDATMTVGFCAPPASAGFDSAIAVFAGACGSLSLLVCSDDHCGASASASFDASAGETYLIAVGGADGSQGPFNLALLEAPPNDTCAGAIPITARLTSGSNVGATTGLPTGSCGAMGTDVWYRYTPLFSGVVSAGFCGGFGGSANFDIAIAAFRGTCGSLTEIACDDRFCSSAHITFPVVGGEAYWLALGGTAGEQGAFDLIVDLTATAPLTFDELRKLHVPHSREATSTLAVGDVDSDGDPDVILVDGTQTLRPKPEQVHLFLNDGAGSFSDVSATHVPAEIVDIAVAALADVDRDGDLDLALGTVGPGYALPADRLYLNDGTGVFVDASTRLPSEAGLTRALAFADVDRDGDLDLAVGQGASIRLYRNDGAGFFAGHPVVPPLLVNPRGLAFADVDGDADLDLVVANFNQRNHLYLNDGNGEFSDVTAAQMPGLVQASRGLVVADFDSDGDLDLAFANAAGEASRVYRNDGLGGFVEATSSALLQATGDASSVVANDVDGDGDVDLLFGNQGSSGERRDCLYLNDGVGNFVDAGRNGLSEVQGDTRDVALVDVDADADLDVLAGMVGQDRLYLNDGNGGYADASEGRLPADKLDWAFEIALVDVDGDDDLDVLQASPATASGQNRLYLNDGIGNYRDATSLLPAVISDSRALAIGDVDGDGDPDALVGNRSEQNRLYLNDGSGRFVDVTATHLPLDGDNTRRVFLVDVDGDVDLDAILGNDLEQHRLYLNDGNGRFADATATHLPQVTETTIDLAATDVDGDGDVDLVLGNWSTFSKLYRNDGTGVFVDAGTTLPGMSSFILRGLDSADVDGDGDMDLVVATSRQDRLYLNDGTGAFVDATAARLPAADLWTNDAVFGDLDADGDVDLALAVETFDVCSEPCAARIYLNEAGSFVFADGWLPAHLDSSFRAAVGDVDGDADVDLVFTTRTENRVFSSLRWQIDAPLLARAGRPFRLEFYGQSVPQADAAIPFLATRRGRISAAPLGTFGLDPSATVALPQVAMPTPTGRGSLLIPLPNDPAIVGLTIYAQALLTSGGVPVRLTNVRADRVVH
ncbi:MAG: VCBS repeat-containing protein [Planctomycetota bacterium]